MRRTTAVLLLALVAGCTSQGPAVFDNNWMQGLHNSINQLTANIEGNVRQLTDQIQGNVQQLNRQIQEDVRGRLAQIDRLNSDVTQTIDKAGNQPRITLSNGGSTIVVNGGVNGSARTIFSGHGPNGEPYLRDIEERSDGHTLHHTEKNYNPATGKMEEIKWTLDLTKPGAKPVIVSN